MKNKSNMTAGEKARESIVAYANYALIAPGGKLGEFHVMSRMLLWCKGGCGKVTVNLQTFELSAGTFMLLPWGHRIRYFNHLKEPWSLAGIHIIPKLPIGAPMEYKVKHLQNDMIKGGELRKDLDLGRDLSVVVKGHFDFSSGLFHLVEHVVQWFRKGKIREDKARLYAKIILDEIEEQIKNPSPLQKKLPVSLKKMIDFIESSLDKKIRMSDLENAGSCSPATVCRLFKRHLNMSPVSWINSKRVDRASEFLLSTDLRVGEIAEKVGIGDLFYFSKIFKNVKGVSARKYRNETGRLI